MTVSLERIRALKDVAEERQRQVDEEGWSEEHDDGHEKGEMAAAAMCYAWGARLSQTDRDLAKADPRKWWNGALLKMYWPWDREWWKPKDRRRDLVRAAALIVAEIERLDRKEKKNAE